MRLASKGSQVQCDHRRPLSEQSWQKSPCNFIQTHSPETSARRLFVQPRNNTTLDVDPVAKNCCFRMSYVSHLIWAQKTFPDLHLFAAGHHLPWHTDSYSSALVSQINIIPRRRPSLLLGLTE